MLILLNGPPRSGKDTAGQWLSKWLGLPLVKLTAPLDRAIAAFFQISPQRWAYLREEGKDQPAPELFGYTPRQVLISLGEHWAKPLLGQDVFGQLAPKYGIITDVGFRPEAEALVQPDHTFLVRIHRPGCTFANDSRSYIDLSDLNVPTYDLNNSSTLEAYQQAVYNLSTQLLHHLAPTSAPYRRSHIT